AAVQLLDMDDHPELWHPPANLIDKAKLGGIPRHGIGRGFKVSKEEIAALLVALRLFTSGAYDEAPVKARLLLEQIAEKLNDCPARCRVLDKGDGESLPLLEIAVDEVATARTAMEICRSLRRGDPPIYVSHGGLWEGKLLINPLHLDDSSAAILAERIRQELGG
ncbi:MAG: selenocysteine synthase, partial [Candidatus Poribacteria bacterium]|nr:selenocysteine synthase [Candidatus Poribacteria bacterium]